MKTIKYTTININEIQANVSYIGICDKETRKKCEKEKECGIGLCGNEIDKIAFGKIIWTNLTKEQFNKRIKKVDEWRKKEFRKCKAVEFIIQKVK